MRRKSLIYFSLLALFTPKLAIADDVVKVTDFSINNGILEISVEDTNGENLRGFIGCLKPECETSDRVFKGTAIGGDVDFPTLQSGDTVLIKGKKLKNPINYRGSDHTLLIRAITNHDKVIGNLSSCTVRRNKKLIFKIREFYKNTLRPKFVRFSIPLKSKFAFSCRDFKGEDVIVKTSRTSLRRHDGLASKPILLSDGEISPDPIPTTSPPEVRPTNTPKPEATSTPEPEATNTPRPVPTAIPTVEPTSTPRPEPTSTLIPQSTSTPIPQSTSTPIPEATNTPRPPMMNMPPIKEPAGGFPVGVIKSSTLDIERGSIGNDNHENHGAMRTHCRFSHFSYDDPIVFPGVKNATHLHMFFGNTKADAFSTINSIRNSGSSTCDGGIANRSAYWIPAMLDKDGVPLGSYWINVYYKSINKSQANITIPIPDGLQMVAGNAKANEKSSVIGFDECYKTNVSNKGKGVDACHSSYECERFSDRGRYNKSNTIRGANCRPGDSLVLGIDFPQCWDGKRLNSSDQSHMAYMRYDGGYPNCPSTHPVRIPDIKENIYFRVPASGVKDWHLSSDMYDWKTHGGGLSRHADLFEGWNTNVKNRVTQNCIKAGINCNDNTMNDGEKLKNLDNWAFVLQNPGYGQFKESPYVQ